MFKQQNTMIKSVESFSNIKKIHTIYLCLSYDLGHKYSNVIRLKSMLG